MTQELTPVSPAERIGSLDFLRGLAVLGILVINIESFAFPEPWSPYKYGYQKPLDHEVRFWVYFLAQGKFFSMFTLLFGVGFYIFIDRLTQKQPGIIAVDRYARRLLVLFVIGVAHAYLIWDGDVLYHYAVCGLLLFPFRSLKVQGLMITLLVFMLVVVYNSTQSTLRNARQKAAFEFAQSKAEAARTADDEKAIATWERRTSKKRPANEEVQLIRNSIWESIAVNASHQKVHKGVVVYQGILFRTLIMMILGMIFYRIGVFHDFRRLKGYWVFTGTMLLLALAINFSRYYQWTFEYDQPVTRTWLGIAHTFPKELLGLAYVLLFNGIFQLVKRHLRWNIISNMGRMALTNYLTQSIICGLLFYGYGLGLYHQLSRSELWMIIPLIWVFQMILSSWIISRYGQGPVERLWRTIVYSD